ncbi:DUF1573 domain-containing protein [Candidatus Magnetobacterium casensis]|uniref:DUF1573 domain-containing protein n=2 Tax=Candidatus Magnetobacterium casense TaxID=1455061 RepID=A0ABS6RUA8_9BACT|nr:DUF1573 domain-containing protein [Candidatus Magnetobacterium casensis]
MAKRIARAIVLAAVVTLSLTDISFAVPPGKAHAVFKETKYDFGSVKRGQTVRHQFELTNAGTEKLIIKDVIPG